MAKQTALIAASFEYQDDKLQKLRSPGLDAEGLARVLRDPEVGNFDVRVLPNRPGYVIQREIGRFFAKGKRDDLLLLYFSCHGVKDDDGNLYFAAVDTEVDNLDGTAVSADWVSRQITKSRSRRVLLLLDCCYSGAFAKGMVPKGDAKVHIKERFTGDGRGRVVLTASDDMEYAWEGDTLSGAGQPSIFTNALVQGLETGEADRDKDGFVAVDELYDYVFDRVVERTPNQKPNKWSFDVEGELRIARSKFASDLALLPSALRIAIANPLPGVREGAVQELGHLLKEGDVAVGKGARAALVNLAVDSDTKVARAAQATLDGFEIKGDITIVLPEVAPSGKTDGDGAPGNIIDLTPAPVEPPPTDPEPKVTEPPVTEPPVTEPPVTEPPVAEPKEPEPGSPDRKPAIPWLDRLKFRNVLIAVAIVAVAIGAAIVWPDRDVPPNNDPPEVLAPEIVFVRDGVLYGMAADGTGSDPIDGAPEGIGEPARSHDGKRIAYVKDGNLFVMEIDGSEPRPLTESKEHDDHPEWSPDDSWIAFSREDPADSDIWAVELETGELTQLTFTPEIVEAGPTWSPDGNQIAFRQGVPIEGTGISAVDFPAGDKTPDGTGRDEVVPVMEGENQRAPSWSPDEHNPLIVYHRNFKLRTVDVQREVDKEFEFAEGAPGEIRMPVWAPDGSAILFVVNKGPDETALYRVNSNGKDLKELEANASEPSWTGTRAGL